MLKRVLLLSLADPGNAPYAPNAWWKHWWRCFWISAAVVLSITMTVAAFAHDDGQWGETTPEITSWYRALKMPDNPSVSCCGESDAYFADAFTRDGKTIARIVDDRPDEPRHRPHIPVGTEIEVPNHKLKFDAGNPTGHAVIFLGASHVVYCFVQGTGI